MSFPSKEKGREGSTSVELDEDSGHDSVDSLHTAADERERIAHLETAVSWIRQEVVSGCVRQRWPVTSVTRGEGNTPFYCVRVQ